MARVNPRTEAALKRVAARHRAAGKKVFRLKAKGVQTGSIDPRRPWSEVQSMSSAERRTYERQLNRFISRSTGFVAGSKGAPLPSATVNRYRKLEKEFNAKVKAWNAAIADLPIAGTGMTVGQRRDMLATSRFPRPGGNWKTLQEFNRSLRGVTGVEGLQKLIADLQQRLRPGFVRKEMAQQRASLEKMLTDTGDTEVWEQVKGLSDRQLQALVDETDFMTNVGYRYTAQRSDGGDTNDDVYGTAGLTVRSLADWAHSIPKR